MSINTLFNTNLVSSVRHILFKVGDINHHSLNQLKKPMQDLGISHDNIDHLLYHTVTPATFFKEIFVY